jgi:Spy/CpxP family protein refolding chaperone
MTKKLKVQAKERQLQEVKIKVKRKKSKEQISDRLTRKRKKSEKGWNRFGEKITKKRQ